MDSVRETMERSIPRRRALAGLGAAALLPLGQARAQDEYPHDNLAAAFAAAGFDPRGAGCWTFIAAADTHWGGTGEERLAPLIDEVNAIDPAPRFLVVNGDIINHASLNFGQVPDDAQKAVALEQLRGAKAELERLKPEIPYHVGLGNHDTYPYEEDNALFRSVFDRSPHDAFEVEGLPILVLNGQHGGYLDDPQLDWLKAHVATIPPERPIVFFLHQPSIASVTHERGIGEAVREAFADRTGPLWMIAGHAHNNGDDVWALPRTTLVVARITKATAGAWGSEYPGYWVWGVRDGDVAVRVFRRFGEGYRVAPAPDLSKARPMPIPWEGRDDIVWRVMVGQGDAPYRVLARAGDSVRSLPYLREAVYRLPLAEVAAGGAAPTRFALLATLRPPGDEREGHIFVSADGETWQPLPQPAPERSVFTLDIPESLRGGKHLYVRVISGDGQRSANATLAGVGLGR